MKYWTVWADYYGTGEGRTISAVIVPAISKEEALESFKRTIYGGSFYSLGAYVEEGIQINTIVKFLFSKKVLETFKKNEGTIYSKLAAQYHFNAS